MNTQLLTRGLARGAFLGTGLGALVGLGSALCYSFCKVQEPKVVYQHPKTGRSRTLDMMTHEGDSNLTSLLARLWTLLCVDPTAQPAARDQFHVIVYRLQRFVARLEALPLGGVRARVEMRDEGVRLLRSLGHMERVVWDAREVEEILRIIGHAESFVTNTMLAHDR